LCQSPGCRAVPPMTAASMTKMSTASTARFTPGREGATPCLDVPLLPDQALPRGLDDLLGGVTCAVPWFDRDRFAVLHASRFAAHVPAVGLGVMVLQVRGFIG
jgi:hypothetical protein